MSKAAPTHTPEEILQLAKEGLAMRSVPTDLLASRVVSLRRTSSFGAQCPLARALEALVKARKE